MCTDWCWIIAFLNDTYDADVKRVSDGLFESTRTCDRGNSGTFSASKPSHAETFRFFLDRDVVKGIG